MLKVVAESQTFFRNWSQTVVHLSLWALSNVLSHKIFYILGHFVSFNMKYRTVGAIFGDAQRLRCYRYKSILLVSKL